ncbi:hypothetical protein PARHAE_03905 [Paracoccus haematequi]|uniref:Zeaxanthin glucosyltransferase n=1 Tax=Paracoccus haematequi TaxID=2491866 RepID=A0A3S4EUJ2_9RHOB|nr:hypothetical protein [Paracoccus haematequi]VDS10687.1 hypothetical protein PARHAE_03905 [Paracoccus haematequi]
MRAVLICPPLPSHLRAFEALAQELTRRGHQAIFLTEPGTALQSGAAPTVCAATAWRSCAACRPT